MGRPLPHGAPLSHCGRACHGHHVSVSFLNCIVSWYRYVRLENKLSGNCCLVEAGTL